MINKTTAFIGAALNSFLKEKLAITEDKVIVNRLISEDGSSLPENENKVVITLIHVDEEAAPRSITAFSATKDKKAEQKGSYSISLLLHVNGNDYSESLALLDLIRGFLKSNTEFDAHSAPKFPSELNKLAIEAYSLTIEQQCRIYAMLGVKYQPSLCMKASISLS